jgi:hypothetical protein
MGKAEIVSSDGSGYYTIRVVRNEQRVQDTIDHLQARIAEIDDKLFEVGKDRDDAEAAASEARDELNQAIQDWVAAQGTSEEPEKREELLEAKAAYIKAQRDCSRLKSQYEMWRLEKASAERRISRIKNNLPESTEIQTACVDHTTDLSGTVGTIEPVGLGKIIRIRPGFEDNAAYDSERDGILTPVAAQTAAQAVFNFAMLPGWQKWQPLYRTGTIKNINISDDTGDVELDQATSPAGFNVNQTDELKSIPIEYMWCNAQAFQDGDQVVVEFQGQSWDQPRVIGFVEGPRRCPLYLDLFINDIRCTSSGWFVNIYKYTDGKKGDFLQSIRADKRTEDGVIKPDEDIFKSIPYDQDLLFEVSRSDGKGIKIDDDNPDYYIFYKREKTHYSEIEGRTFDHPIDNVYMEQAIYKGRPSGYKDILESYNYSGYSCKLKKVKNQKNDQEEITIDANQFYGIKLNYTDISKELRGTLQEYSYNLKDIASWCAGPVDSLGELHLTDEVVMDGNGGDWEVKFYVSGTACVDSTTSLEYSYWQYGSRGLTAEEAEAINEQCSINEARQGDELIGQAYACSMVLPPSNPFDEPEEIVEARVFMIGVSDIDVLGDQSDCCNFLCESWGNILHKYSWGIISWSLEPMPKDMIQE